MTHCIASYVAFAGYHLSTCVAPIGPPYTLLMLPARSSRGQTSGLVYAGAHLALTWRTSERFCALPHQAGFYPLLKFSSTGREAKTVVVGG